MPVGRQQQRSARHATEAALAARQRQPGALKLRLTHLATRIEERILDRPGDRFKKSGGGVVQARHRYYTEN